MNNVLLVAVFFAILATVRLDDDDSDSSDNLSDEKDYDEYNDDDDDDDDDDDGDDNDDDGKNNKDDNNKDERKNWKDWMFYCSDTHGITMKKIQRKSARLDDSFCENEASRDWSTCWLRSTGMMTGHHLNEKFTLSRIKDSQKSKFPICKNAVQREIAKKGKKWAACVFLQCCKRNKIDHKND